MATSIFSRSGDGGSKRVSGPSFIIGRVKNIVLGPEKYDGLKDENYNFPSDIGKIYYEIMYSNMNLVRAEATSTPAYPIFNFVKQYPLISEIVLIVPGPDPDLNDSISSQGYYYFPPFSLWSSLNHNAFPNLEEYADYVQKYYTHNNKEEIPSLPMGHTFSENESVKPLRVFEGDTIIESRFGQSIRFGSTVRAAKAVNNWSDSGENGKPITIIRNGQNPSYSNPAATSVVEDINTDLSSIWLTSGQEIDLKLVDKFPKRSYGILKTKDANNYVAKTDRVATSKMSISPMDQDNKYNS